MAEQIYPDWYYEEWVQLLQAAREEHGPTAVGKMINKSAALVIGVCDGTYKADPRTNIKRAVLAAFGVELVSCPIGGEIELAACDSHRNAAFVASNPLRVRYWRACQTCPNNPDRRGDDG